MGRKLSGDDACIEYAMARSHVRHLNRSIRATRCEIEEPAEKSDYATNYPGYEGFTPCWERVRSGQIQPEEMCEKCKEKDTLRNSLKLAKDILRTATRRVESAGARAFKNWHPEIAAPASPEIGEGE